MRPVVKMANSVEASETGQPSSQAEAGTEPSTSTQAMLGNQASHTRYSVSHSSYSGRSFSTELQSRRMAGLGL